MSSLCRTLGIVGNDVIQVGNQVALGRLASSCVHHNHHRLLLWIGVAPLLTLLIISFAWEKCFFGGCPDVQSLADTTASLASAGAFVDRTSASETLTRDPWGTAVRLRTTARPSRA